MPDDPILYETRDAVATLTLNRPERLNTIVPELIDELNAALDRAQSDPSVRVIRLRGAGRSFCAGYDIDWGAELMQQVDAEGRAEPASDIYSLGATLVYLLAHKEPSELIGKGFGLEFDEHVHISSGFRAVLRKMLQPEIEKRYQTASELKADLLALQAGRMPQSIMSKAFAAIGALFLAACLMTWFFVDRAETPVKAPSKPVLSDRQPLPLEQTAAPSLSGQLVFEGRPIHEVTGIQPKFWFRNEKEGTVQHATASYENGKFTIYGLPPGRYGVSTTIDANETNGWSYPGDFRAWNTFTIPDTGISPPLTIEMEKIISMKSPQNNNKVLEGWGADWEHKFQAQRPLKLEWESLGEDVYYDYEINLMQEPYVTKDTAASGTTKGTKLKLDLPTNQEGEYYLLRLSARRHGLRIGLLMTHGANGYGWDYRFRLQ